MAEETPKHPYTWFNVACNAAWMATLGLGIAVRGMIYRVPTSPAIEELYRASFIGGGAAALTLTGIVCVKGTQEVWDWGKNNFKNPGAETKTNIQGGLEALLVAGTGATIAASTIGAAVSATTTGQSFLSSIIPYIASAESADTVLKYAPYALGGISTGLIGLTILGVSHLLNKYNRVPAGNIQATGPGFFSNCWSGLSGTGRFVYNNGKLTAGSVAAVGLGYLLKDSHPMLGQILEVGGIACPSIGAAVTMQTPTSGYSRLVPLAIGGLVYAGLNYLLPGSPYATAAASTASSLFGWIKETAASVYHSVGNWISAAPEKTAMVPNAPSVAHHVATHATHVVAPAPHVAVPPTPAAPLPDIARPLNLEFE